MNINTILLFLALVQGFYTSAQRCEIEHIGKYNTRADNIIQLNDKTLLIAGRYGYGGQHMGGLPFKQFVFIRKTDLCNNLIWEKILDSTSSNIDALNPLSVKVDSQNTITVTHYRSILDTLKEFVVDMQGNLITIKKNKFSNYNQPSIFFNPGYYGKISENKFLLLGFYSLGYYYLRVIITDSSQNTLSQSDINLYAKEHNLVSYKKTGVNKLTIVLKYKYSDSIFKIVNVDTLANVLDTLKLTFNNPFPKTFSVNENNTWYYASGNKYLTDSLNNILGVKSFIARYSLNGTVNKLIETDKIFYNCYDATNNKILCLTSRYYLILDSSFALLKQIDFDSFNSPGFYNNDAYANTSKSILSTENHIIQVGYLSISSGLTSFPQVKEYFKSDTLFKYIKSISIKGLATINSKGGTTKLIAEIAPSDAENKALFWSLNDTSKAEIDQSGVLTAKANGNIVVTVQTTDGSNLSATKTISIINQQVGLAENRLDNHLQLYPNPTSGILQIISTLPTIESVEVFDLTGRILAQFHEQSEYDLGFLANGTYGIRVLSNQGLLNRKILIRK